MFDTCTAGQNGDELLRGEGERQEEKNRWTDRRINTQRADKKDFK
jgi:hypothetical protein